MKTGVFNIETPIVSKLKNYKERHFLFKSIRNNVALIDLSFEPRHINRSADKSIWMERWQQSQDVAWCVGVHVKSEPIIWIAIYT